MHNETNAARVVRSCGARPLLCLHANIRRTPWGVASSSVHGIRGVWFTLIELLVVIAIIAILASLLLPALGRARETAYGVVCTGNQRQIATAVHIYSSDFDDLPPLTRGDTGPGQYVSWMRLIKDVGVLSQTTTEIAAMEGVFFCPSKARYIATLEHGHTRTYWPGYAGHYGMSRLSGTVSGGVVSTPNNSVGPYSLSGIRRPSETALIAEGSLQYQYNLSRISCHDYLNTFYDGWPGNCYDSRTYPAQFYPLHFGRVGVALFDGSAVMRPASRYPGHRIPATDPIYSMLLQNPQRGYLEQP